MAENSNNPTWTETDQKEYDKYKIKHDKGTGIWGEIKWNRINEKKQRYDQFVAESQNKFANFQNNLSNNIETEFIQPQAFIEKNPDGTATYYTKAPESALKPNKEGNFKYDAWNQEGAKNIGYYQAPFALPKNSELINLSGIQYIISPDRKNNLPTLNRVEENSAAAEVWTSAQEPFSLANKAGTRNLTDAYSDENISTALLNEAKYYADTQGIDMENGNWTQEQYNSINKFKKLADSYALNMSDAGGEKYKDAQYSFQKTIMSPYYIRQLEDTKEWQIDQAEIADAALTKAIASGADEQTINRLAIAKEQKDKDLGDRTASLNESIKQIKDALAPEKRTPKTYGMFDDFFAAVDNALSPGAIGNIYTIDQEGNKLIGTSVEEKQNILNVFGQNLLPAFEGVSEKNQSRNNTNIVTSDNIPTDQTDYTNNQLGNGTGTGTGTGTNQKQRIGVSGGYSRSGTGYQPDIKENKFVPTTEFINDLGTTAAKAPDGTVVMKERTMKDVQRDIADIDSAIGKINQPIEEVGAYAPDLEPGSNIGGFIGDAGRALIGIRGAMEEVPEYQTGEMYNLAMDEMTARRDLGMSDEEIAFSRNLAERGYGYDVKNVRRLAGGSAGVALGNLGRAQNQLYDQYANIAAADQRVRRANRDQFYRGAMADENINRQKFQDEFQQAVMNKQSGAMLVNDALSNMDERMQFNKAYGKGSPYYEMMKSTWESSEQERINKSEALKNTRQSNIDKLNKQKEDYQSELDEMQTLGTGNQVVLPNPKDNTPRTIAEQTLQTVPDNVQTDKNTAGDATEIAEYQRRVGAGENEMDVIVDLRKKRKAGQGILDNLNVDNTEETIVEQIPITGDTDNLGDPMATDNKPVAGELEKVSPENQTWEDKLADYKSEFKDEETLAKYEENPIAFVEEDIKGWESEPDSEQKTQSLKNLRENLEILKREKGEETKEGAVEAADIIENVLLQGGTEEDAKAIADKYVSPGTSLVESTEENVVKADDVIQSALEQGATTEEAEALANEYVSTGELISNKVINKKGFETTELTNPDTGEKLIYDYDKREYVPNGTIDKSIPEYSNIYGLDNVSRAVGQYEGDLAVTDNGELVEWNIFDEKWDKSPESRQPKFVYEGPENYELYKSNSPKSATDYNITPFINKVKSGSSKDEVLKDIKDLSKIKIDETWGNNSLSFANSTSNQILNKSEQKDFDKLVSSDEFKTLVGGRDSQIPDLLMEIERQLNQGSTQGLSNSFLKKAKKSLIRFNEVRDKYIIQKSNELNDELSKQFLQNL